MTTDVVIIGGGPAGLTAALYASRRGVRVVLLTEDTGGQATMTARIENYPGVDPVDGRELMMRFQRQAVAAGADVRHERALSIAHHGQNFTVTTTRASYETETVILATGLTRRRLAVPGEETFIGRGVYYGLLDQPRNWAEKSMAVVGSGNSAMDTALLLANENANVHLFIKHPELRGERVLIDRVQASPRITVYPVAEVTRIEGQAEVSGIVFMSHDREQRMDVDGVDVEIGFIVNPELTRGLVDVDGKQQVIIEPGRNATSVPGMFAAGDITTILQKQVVISAGEGAKAGMSAAEYILARRGQPMPSTDWTHHEPLRHEQSSSSEID